MILSLIAALGSTTRAIGKDGALLWHIPEDLARFKRLTMGHPLIMGRKTFESIGRPLPGRTSIVVTRNTAWSHEGVLVAHSLDEALKTATTLDPHEIFVIGGGELYAQTIGQADRLYLTLVDDATPGDTFFPDYEHVPFKMTVHTEGAPHSPRYSFALYERS